MKTWAVGTLHILYQWFNTLLCYYSQVTTWQRVGAILFSYTCCHEQDKSNVKYFKVAEPNTVNHISCNYVVDSSTNMVKSRPCTDTHERMYVIAYRNRFPFTTQAPLFNRFHGWNPMHTNNEVCSGFTLSCSCTSNTVSFPFTRWLTEKCDSFVWRLAFVWVVLFVLCVKLRYNRIPQTHRFVWVVQIHCIEELIITSLSCSHTCNTGVFQLTHRAEWRAGV